ncbi:hypothetical protein Godav_010524 [Gossypium davidsonii]|uniref:Uncharacterized protein n=2 Tax=Gossypium davidsonii TaxID=34287 RepID=A0A7J8SGW2_GOSDV|nr:hypothetical protein [Gossypium davidsonii]
MALVVGKDMATRSFARTFADINLDYGNQDSVPINCNNKDVEEVEEFDDDFLCSVFDYLASRESNVNAFLAKSTKYRKIWLQKFSQG